MADSERVQEPTDLRAAVRIKRQVVVRDDDGDWAFVELDKCVTGKWEVVERLAQAAGVKPDVALFKWDAPEKGE